ncbi:MAG: SpaA isopeptide-forming pilin-related protein, partial [Wujia sp.]
VYPMTVDEARALTQVAVHSTVSGINVTGISGKTSGANVTNAYNSMKEIATYCGALRTNNSLATVAALVDTTAAYRPSQSITTQIYNVAASTWETYTSGTALSNNYKDASGNVKFRVNYTSSGMCNKLLTNASSGKITVSHNGTTLSVNGNTGYYDYLQIKEATGNAVNFMAEYGALTSRTQTVNDTFRGKTISQDVFEQTVTITAKYGDLQTKKLAFTATTGVGAAHTQFFGDGDNNGKSAYAARIFKNVSYQDACFISPNQSLSKSVSVSATAQANGSIQIHKYSANPEITDGNNCYSLKGAVFGIFRTRADAQAATEANENAVATITTDAAGNGSAGNLEYGTYYVKETKASPGYRVNTNIYMANIASDTPVVFDVPEEAGADPASVLVRKKNSEETVYLEGAVFAIKYYDVQMTVDPATAGKQPVRTWYIKTDEDGFADLQNPDCVLLESDELYYRQDTGLPSIPIGTITVQEIEAPEGYIIDNTIHTFVINDNPEGIPHVDVENERTIPNSPMQQPFELVKLGEGESENYPLADAGFSACRINDLVEAPAGYTAASGEVLVKDPETGKYYIWDDDKAVILTSDGKTEMFTDENGYAKSIPLNYGRYIVRETTVPKNFHAIDAFVVTISENTSEPVSMGYFVDKSFKAYLKIVKKDDATGKNILNNAATFKIWSYDKKGYQSFTDSAGTKVTELKTDADGVLMTPAPLMPGRYRIDEIANPEGYYTSDPDKTYDITIADDAVYKVYKKEDGTVTDMGVFEVEIENTAYKGVIGITKNGESRKFNVTTGEFETEKVHLSGVTFKIYADEDIYTADGSGTLLIEKDALADTLVTDKDGYAASKELPLGTYRIEEDTPEGYVDMDPQFVTLTADGEKTVLDNEDGTRKETIRYELEIDNKLKIPKIHTTAKDTKGNKELKAEGTVTIIDTVYYEDLIPGKTYTVSGYSVYSDGDKLLADGKPVEVSLEFTPSSETGSVDVTYQIDAEKLAGKSIVFFEFVYRDKELIALHTDINDKGQTITFLPDVPKTGDSTKPVIFIIISMAALAGIVLLIRARRKIK